jgi:hypothetical protein
MWPGRFSTAPGLVESGLDGQWTGEDATEWQRIIVAFQAAGGFGRNSARYSTRRAWTGLMDAARRAGIIPAMQAATTRTTIATAMTPKPTLAIS